MAFGDRLTKRQTKIARQRAERIIKDIKEDLINKYIFSYKLVGSGAWGTMIEDQEGMYDLDYQMILTKNSKEYKESELKHSTEIKQDFLSAFNKNKNDDETIEDSTTAITLINEDDKPFTIDFVIIKVLPENELIIRRNIKKETITVNEYTWNQIPRFNEAYQYFKSLDIKEKEMLVNDEIIPRKIKEKSKNENDPTKISSCQAFIEEVNNYKDEKERNQNNNN